MRVICHAYLIFVYSVIIIIHNIIIFYNIKVTQL